MVSLAAIEDTIYSLWPDNQHAILNIPHPRKGEQIILVTNFKHAEQKVLIEYFRKQGIAEITLPRKIIILDKIPVLASGKVDYKGVKFILENAKDDEIRLEDEDQDEIE